MNRLHYSPEALNDLDEIWTYISEELHNPAAALNTVEYILNAIDNLRKFSEMGPPLNLITGIESNYRFLVCGKYIAFYRVDKVEVTLTVYYTAGGITCVFCSVIYQMTKI